ncbi:MAG: ribosome biogenesis GTPase Der [Verrucomicrobiaceae bacterium]|nr:ribosome biogenesis GTPase Der [Verrucomicrobiaceae bacterium]
MNPSERKMVAIVGRPNVGKSALFNRLAGKNISIVHDQAGVTRDRITAECRRGPEVFDIMDTGGIGASTDDVLTDQVQIEAEVGLEVADLLLFVVDVIDGITTIDQALTKVLRKTSKPVVLVCNKADSAKRKLGAADFAALGFKDTVDVSAAHGLGIKELVDVIAARLNLTDKPRPQVTSHKDRPLKLAIVGRPNAGKSSLVNAVLGEQRAIVSEVAGTTRDSLDIKHTRGEQTYQLIDTAGIRRQAKLDDDVEIFSVKRAVQSIERADICLLVVDCAEGIKMQDRKIAQLILESRKPCILVMNKWDLFHPSAKPKDRMEELTETVKREFFFLHFAPIVPVSAKKNQGLDKLFKTIDSVKEGAQKRVGTGVLNRVLQRAIDYSPGPIGTGSHTFKLLYATQVNHREEEAVPVPHFVLFANRAFKLQDSYLRFLESKIREEFPGVGLPFVLKVKGKAKK